MVSLLLVCSLIKLSNFYILVGAKSNEELILSGPKYQGIYLYNVKSGDVKKIAEGNAFKLALSPNRDKILYADYDKIKLLHFDGSEKVIVEHSEKVGFPVWIDDSLLAYTFGGVLHIVDTLGNLKTTIDGVRSYYIDYSPEAKLFAFQEDDQIYLIDWDGNKKKITDDGVFFAPLFSPNGRFIAYNEISKGIFIYDIGSGESIFVSKGNNPSWSPDGNLLIFNISQDNGYDIISSEIYVYSVAEKFVKKLTSSKDVSELKPFFSPDGKRVYFCTPEGSLGYVNFGKLLR
ncbi:MAG: hypothetical protein QMD82_05485 [bacterium]|nr:hypothetical protein [bacterium]